jgi:aspartyl-tRNA(Asn)/glutamyl-tRNA(Gln) amidotransferase subunit A
MAMGSSLDQIGPFAHSVEDAEEVYKIITGHDEQDSTSLPESVRNKEQGTMKKVVGVPQSFVSKDGVDAEVLENFNASIEKLKQAGYTIKDITINHLEKALSVYYVIMFAEVSSNLARYDGIAIFSIFPS